MFFVNAIEHMDNRPDSVYNKDILWDDDRGADMKERVYFAIDLRNAEEKEMPILSAKPTTEA